MASCAKPRRSYLYFILVAIVVAAIVLWWLWPKPLRVKLYQVHRETLQNRVFATGVVRPNQRQVLLTSELPSPFENFQVRVGDTVQKGSLLLTTASEPKGSVSLPTTSTVPYLRARFRGVVLTENPNGMDENGNSVPLLELVSPERQVLVDLSEEDAVHIHPGMKATITAAAYPNRTWYAKVHTVANYAAPTTSGGANEVEAAIQATQPFSIPYGYQVNVNLVLRSHPNVAVVPYSALIQAGSVYQVYVVGQGDRVQARTVTLGTTGNTLVEVTHGVQPGEKIVDNPPSGLSSGQVVVHE